MSAQDTAAAEKPMVDAALTASSSSASDTPVTASSSNPAPASEKPLTREVKRDSSSSSPSSKPNIQESNDPEVLKRALAEALEKYKEQEATIKKLRHEVDVERGHVTILRHDNQVLRQSRANMHAVAEQEEENISNRLLRRISGLRREKSGDLMMQVEQEEEYLTKTLQNRLSQLQREKIDLENALEQEQEYIVNRLQKQLDAMRMEQSTNTSAASSWQDREHSIASGLPIGSSPINIAGGGRPSRINPNPSPTPSPARGGWLPSHSPSSSDHGPSHPIIDMLKAELTAAKVTVNELEREYMIKFKQCNRYRSEVLALRQELALPIASDLLVEDSLPSVLSPAHRSGGTPSRRNSSTSVSGSSRVSYGVPATPTNTPANPAPINHHFTAQRVTLTPHNPQMNPFSNVGPGSGVLNHYSTSPTLTNFPGGSGLNGSTGSNGGFPPSGATAANSSGHSQAYAPHHHHHNYHHHPYTSSGNSGTASFSSSVGSLGSTSPMMSMASSVSSTSGLPAIVPERQSLYRSRSSSRQHAQYITSQQHAQHHQPLHHAQQQQQQQQQQQPPQQQAQPPQAQPSQQSQGQGQGQPASSQEKTRVSQ
ncbi:hypothetical protein BGZ65_001413 [Modicella reniformis]|uniref:Uncharacterized protein n=1 Tax=Modicella reniformis TaxID=1440133 RepID=A0A9P6IM38_9FUNG|nr:hypothetical protein BGZ65_001413 [Modicella reniformis]